MRLVGAAVPRKRQREELPLSDQLLVGRLQLGLDASAKKSHISRKHLQNLRQGGRWLVRRLAANPAKLRRAATKLRRSPRRSRNISSSDPALNNLVALPNELLCKVLAYWHA